MSRDAFVLRRPPSAFGPLAYYPPNAIKRAEWLTAGAADAARVNLIDGPALGSIAKFVDNSIRHLPHDWPLDPCGVDEWLTYAKREGAT